MKFRIAVLSLLIINFVFLRTAVAEESICVSQTSSTIQPNSFSPDGKTHLKSDSVEFNEEKTSRFTGSVVIQQPDKRIESDYAEYVKEIEQVNANGNIRFISPDITISSETAKFNLKSDHAILQNTHYQSITSSARGEAQTIEILNQDITTLTDATYTTCESNKSDWYLSADTITLNNKSHQGHASHVVVRFKDVPFFYFPYLRFPIGSERLSGFLFPYFGRSDKHGTEIKIPYYWNINPQIDATITPWYMSDRGMLLHTEFRYLTENSTGTLTAEYLGNDKKAKKDRERLHWQHETKPTLGWQAKAEINYVADADHLRDFSNNLNTTSTTYLVRKGEVNYTTPNWIFDISVEGNQILSGSNPYQRLPRISLNSRFLEKPNTLNYSFTSEAVNFSHADKVVIGNRVHLETDVFYPLRSAAGFFEPRLSLKYTNYNLQQTTGENKISRSIPNFSLNSGLFFDRDSHLFGTDYIQSLEPQLFYVYVPYQDQSNIPVFDTSAYNFNINQSFTNFRFNGIDRIGDDQRLTAALATRFIDQKNGQEVFMARIGQIVYFADRRVQLPSVNAVTTSKSNIIAEIKAQPKNLNLTYQVEWDPLKKEIVLSSSQLGFIYKQFNIDVAHRYQINAIETREMRMNWQLNSKWKVNVNHLYDIRANHLIENLIGINYESCCWGVRFSSKERYISSSLTDRGVYLELVLKGLGGFGIRQ